MTTQAPIARFTRLRHASFASPDPERLLDYYRAAIGLGLVGRDGNRIFLANDAEQLSLVIEPGHAALTSIAFEIAPDVQIETLGAALKQADLRPELQSDPLPGVSRLLSFSDPEGTRFELIQGWTPTPAQERIGALAVSKIGHVALATPDPRAASEFYANMMGLRVSDWIEDRFVFMRSGFEHHTLNFARAQSVACIMSRSSCVVPPTCTRPAIISRGTSCRFSGGRCVMAPGTTPRSTTAIPTGMWSSCSSISTA